MAEPLTGHKTVLLRGGPVTLRGWTPALTEELWHLMMRVSATFQIARQDWQAMEKQDFTQDVWDAFWQLVNASLVPGSKLPKGGVTLADRWALLEAMWSLNDLDEAEGKAAALETRMTRRLTRMAEREARQKLSQSQT